MRPSQNNPTLPTELRKEALFYCLVPVRHFASKKNRKSIYRNKAGSLFIGSDKATKNLLDELFILFSQEKVQFGLKEPIKDPIQAIFRFHYPFKKDGTIPKRVTDLSNLYQGPEDVLQKCGIIEDDKLIESHDKSMRVYGTPEKAIEVCLLKATQYFY